MGRWILDLCKPEKNQTLCYSWSSSEELQEEKDVMIFCALGVYVLNSIQLHKLQ